MAITLLVQRSARLDPEPCRFKDIQQALNFSHKKHVDLFEDDDGESNLIYSNRWDTPTRRAVWRTLLSAYGLSPYDRNLLPKELRAGTIGPDFEVT